MPGSALAAASALLLSSLVGAQAESDDRVTPPGGQVTVTKSRRIPPAAQVTTRRETRAPVEQLHAPARATVATPQLNREARPTTAAAQAGRAERSARGAPALSTRREGRQTGVVRVQGRDRCDPQAPGAEGARCRNVIETRAAEFARGPANVLSPEQRLLVDQEGREQRTVRGAADRAARNDIDANAIETQALAAITLSRAVETGPPADQADPNNPTALESIIQIIEGSQAVNPPR